jgi:hypothetical protein
VILPTNASTLTEQQTQTTHLSTIAGDTTSLDSKIVSCDTSSLSTSALQTTANSSLSSLDTKIVACDTGNVVVSSAPIIQGSNGGNATDIQVDSNGILSVKVKELENAGSYGNAWSNASVSASGVSNTIDVSAMTHANVYVLDSDYTSTDTYSVWTSVDNTNFHFHHTFYPYDERATGSVREDKALFELHGVKFLYIQNDGGAKTGVYASVYGSP